MILKSRFLKASACGALISTMVMPMTRIGRAVFIDYDGAKGAGDYGCATFSNSRDQATLPPVNNNRTTTIPVDSLLFLYDGPALPRHTRQGRSIIKGLPGWPLTS